MTAFKTILACLSDTDACESTLRLALMVGRRHGAQVQGLHVRSDPTAAMPFVAEGMSSAMIDEMMAIADQQSTERAAQVLAKFNAVCQETGVPSAGPVPGDHGFCVAWREEVGREEEILANASRLADLVVIGRPLPDHDQPSMMSLNAALLEGGRPLLLAPPVAPGAVGTHVAVFWNGSAEAARAVAFAMPFLVLAEKVSILSAREEEGVNPAELAAYLAHHGITAEIHSFAAGSQTGETLIAEARSMAADLVVMGAYTHSRLRQLILGGVTRHILHHDSPPVLLSH